MTDRAATAGPRAKPGWLSRHLPVVLLMLAFLCLLGAGAAAAWGQFKPGKTAPMVSVVFSACAFALTLAAVWVRPRR
jgi:hypothetical protein